jgi:hypothetical protein
MCGRAAQSMLMEEVVRRENLMVAHKCVVQNGGVPGIDGMTIEDLKDWMSGYGGSFAGYYGDSGSDHALELRNSSAAVWIEFVRLNRPTMAVVRDGMQGPTT